MDTSPNLALPYIIAAQAQKHVTHNDAIRGLDALVQLMVLDKDLSSPPGSPSDGARYIVGPSPTGAWAGQAAKVAAWQDGAWAFYAPRTGWLAWVADEDKLYVHDGSAWGEITVAVGAGASVWGINATADSTNRLAVASAATLFDNVGHGHQAKINKAAATDTASLLFQTGYSGRAEMGTAGDDDFHFKVSADGSSWLEALVIDRSTGEARLPHSARFLSGVAAPINCALAVSAASNALTISLLGADGNNPSASNPVMIPFRSATAATGTPVWRSVTGALSLTIPSGATLGTTSNVPFRAWVVAFDDAGAIRLGVIQRIAGGSTPTAMAALADGMIASSTAISDSATSAGTFYTASAVTSKALRILGYIESSSTSFTAGSWGTSGTGLVTGVQLFGPGVPRPGDVLQTKTATSGSINLSTTSGSPQTTSAQISWSMQSACNISKYVGVASARIDDSGKEEVAALFRDTTEVGSRTGARNANGGISVAPMNAEAWDAPGTTSTVTVQWKFWSADGSTTVYFAPLGNGGITQYVSAQEIMA
jgi:hypothetical protein